MFSCRTAVFGQPTEVVVCRAVPYAVACRMAARFDDKAFPALRIHVALLTRLRFSCLYKGYHPGHRALRRLNGGAILQHHEACFGYAGVRPPAF